jgi:hypothetical protein
MTQLISDLITKLRQNDDSEPHDAKMLLRSGLEVGAEDVNLADLRKDEEPGIHEDQNKRKNPQVRSFVFNPNKKPIIHLISWKNGIAM